jgi:hypothetical protein
MLGKFFWISMYHKQCVDKKESFEVSHPHYVDQLYNQKNVLNIWLQHNYISSHSLLHTTTCFGPVYWTLSGCITNLLIKFIIQPYDGQYTGPKHVVVCSNLCDDILLCSDRIINTFFWLYKEKFIKTCKWQIERWYRQCCLNWRPRKVH